MSYQFVAATKEGKIKRGSSDLASRAAVIEDLESRGLIVIAVEEARLLRAAARFGAGFFGRVSHVDRVLMTKHLAVMLRAGLTLIESLRILEEQATSWRLRSVLHDIVERVQGGSSFSDAMAQHPEVFTAFFVNIVRAGEVSGTLDENLDHLANQLQKDHEIRLKVQAATLYPAVVLIAALAIGFFFATYILPQVANLFVGLKGIKLPLVTVVLLKVSAFVRRYTLASFIGLFASVAFAVWFLRRRFLAPVTHQLILRAPILRKIVQDVNLARFSLVLSTLLKSGIPITQSVQVTSEVLGNYYYKKALARTLGIIQGGEPLSEGLAIAPNLFPKVVVRMVNVGERSGKLEDVLGYLSEFYDLEVQSSMRNLTNILEPVLLLTIGFLALALAFAIIIPIYNFIGMISQL